MRKPECNDSYLSLIQSQDPRRATLAKMRGKLAGGSEWKIQASEKKRAGARANALGWGWKLALAALIVAGNAWYFSSGAVSPMRAESKHAQVLPPPAPALETNDQALYWTYALYDFDLLKQRFGAPQGAIVNASTAAERLRELLPKVDTRTRFIIQGYMPRSDT